MFFYSHGSHYVAKHIALRSILMFVLGSNAHCGADVLKDDKASVDGNTSAAASEEKDSSGVAIKPVRIFSKMQQGKPARAELNIVNQSNEKKNFAFKLWMYEMKGNVLVKTALPVRNPYISLTPSTAIVTKKRTQIVRAIMRKPGLYYISVSEAAMKLPKVDAVPDKASAGFGVQMEYMIPCYVDFPGEMKFTAEWVKDPTTSRYAVRLKNTGKNFVRVVGAVDITKQKDGESKNALSYFQNVSHPGTTIFIPINDADVKSLKGKNLAIWVKDGDTDMQHDFVNSFDNALSAKIEKITEQVIELKTAEKKVEPKVQAAAEKTESSLVPLR